MTVSETSLVQKNCQISELVKQKTAQLLLNREALTHITEKLAISFIAQDYETKKIITILDNRRQTTIRSHFFKYSKEAREGVKIVTMDMSGNYIPLIKTIFPNAKIVLDRFHIVQHMNRTLKQTRIQIMK